MTGDTRSDTVAANFSARSCARHRLAWSVSGNPHRPKKIRAVGIVVGPYTDQRVQAPHNADMGRSCDRHSVALRRGRPRRRGFGQSRSSVSEEVTDSLCLGLVHHPGERVGPGHAVADDDIVNGRREQFECAGLTVPRERGSGSGRTTRSGSRRFKIASIWLL